MKSDRVDRERDFHNDRFTEETRDDQGKYYFALKRAGIAFENRLLSLAKGGRVMEYGCGAATQAFRLAPVAQSVVGIDISEVAVAAANARVAAEGAGNLCFHVMNAEQLEFPDESFDLVFGRGIIHHLDIDASYSEIA